MLVIKARRHPADGFWWAWINGHDRPLRRVRSLEHVKGVMQEFECCRVDWPAGSYGEMVRAGVAPDDPPDWLR